VQNAGSITKGKTSTSRKSLPDNLRQKSLDVHQRKNTTEAAARTPEALLCSEMMRRANSGHSGTAPTGSSASVALGFKVRTGGRSSAVS
jgi:hypothetical protein